MARRQRRLILVLGGIAILGVAAGLVLSALQQNLVYFYAPADLAEQGVAEGQRFRLGGLVAMGSLTRGADGLVGFRVSDGAVEVAVRYRGLLPDLFREGQGVVAEGRLAADGAFEADSVLAKHDETYMPPEVADALRRQGTWRGGAPAP